MCTVCSYIFQVFSAVVRTGSFNSLWVCNLNKWKKITRRTPQSAKASHVAHSSEQERRVCAGEQQARGGLTWFPSLCFQPCWRTPEKVALMRSARCGGGDQHCPATRSAPLMPPPSTGPRGTAGQQRRGSIWPALALQRHFTLTF